MDEMTELQEEIYVEPAFDSQAIVDKFRDFRDRSKRQFDGNYSTMREDRAFLNGETQWNSKDSKFVFMEGKGHAQYKYVGESLIGEVTDFLDKVL